MDKRFLGSTRKKASILLHHVPEITGHKISDAVTVEALLWEDMTSPSFI